MNTASLKKQIKNLSQSKIVLYILLILAVTNLFGYLISENFTAVFMFLVIGYLTTYFTDNMIIIFAVSIFATNFAIAMNYKRNREGLTTERKSENEDNEDNEDKKTINNNTITVTSKGSNFDNLYRNPLTGKKEKQKNSTTYEAMKHALKDKTPENPVIIDKKKEKGEVEGVCSGPSCKQNSKSIQIENAHAMVDHLLNNPDELNKQQEAISNISKTIETLEPMIDKVENMMNKIGGSKIAGLIGGLGPILGNGEHNK